LYHKDDPQSGANSLTFSSAQRCRRFRRILYAVKERTGERVTMFWVLSGNHIQHKVEILRWNPSEEQRFCRALRQLACGPVHDSVALAANEREIDRTWGRCRGQVLSIGFYRPSTVDGHGRCARWTQRLTRVCTAHPCLLSLQLGLRDVSALALHVVNGYIACVGRSWWWRVCTWDGTDTTVAQAKHPWGTVLCVTV